MAGNDVPRPSLSAARLDAPAGGGAFAFRGLSIGVFLLDQPTHRIALGGDKRLDKPLRAQEGWTLPPGAAGLCEFDADHRFVAVEIDESALRDVGFDAGRTVPPRFGALDPLLSQLALAAASPPSGAPTLYLDTMRQALVAHVAQHLRPAPQTTAPIDDARLRRAIAYIQDDPARDISLASLAAEAAMSPFHFSRAFKAATGVSPLQFVIAERLERAKVLLQTTRLPVAEIAHRVGYRDLSRFARHFRRRFDAAPSTIRS